MACVYISAYLQDTAYFVTIEWDKRFPNISIYERTCSPNNN